MYSLRTVSSRLDIRQPVVVTMADGDEVTVKHLLSRGTTNTKLAKGESEVFGNYVTFGLSLAPAKVSGHQMCPKSTPGCRDSCIFTAGHGGLFPSVPKHRIAKTLALFQHPAWFKKRLRHEVKRAVKYAKDQFGRADIRLNVFSDVAWERKLPELFEQEGRHAHYHDYTKIFPRMQSFLNGELPENYHLTFSHSENNGEDCLKVLGQGGTVAVVFGLTPGEWKKARPTSWRGYPVIDGDEHDLRFLDPPGSVVGLYAKGRGRRDTTGFVVRPQVATNANEERPPLVH